MRRRRRRALLLGLAAAVVTLGQWAPAFIELDNTGWGDWQYFHNMWETGRVALARYGEIALWNPYNCGGIPLWGNPQAQIYAPQFYLSLLTGSTIAIKVHIVLHAFLGLWGMYVFAKREVRLETAPAALAAVAWAMSGTFAWDAAGGHSTFLGFWLYPWLLFCWRQAAKDPRYTAGVAASMLGMFLDGGTYTVAFSVIFLALDAVVRLLDPATRKGVIRAGLLSVLITVPLVAFRVVPAALSITRYPRTNITRAPDQVNLDEVIEMLTFRTSDEHAWNFGHEFVWPEYSSYVGWTVVVLGCIGLLFCLRPGRRWLLAGAAIFLLYMMGNFSEWSPWSLTQRLPLYADLRVPTRFAVIFLFYFALAAGVTLSELHRLLARRRFLRPALLWLLVVGATGDIVVSNMWTTARWNNEPIVETPAGPYHVISDPYVWRLEAQLPNRNQGAHLCHDEIQIPTGSLWMGQVPQARIERGRGRVIDADRTVNTAWADIELEEAALVVFNQTYAPDWVASVGRTVDARHRLAVEVPPGRHRLVVRYRPAELPWVSALALLGALLALAVARWGSSYRFLAVRRFLLRPFARLRRK